MTGRVVDRVRLGYDLCESETRRRAANFGLGIRLLPAPRRRALSAVYWFSQSADDAADGKGPIALRAARLDTLRGDLERSLAGDPPAAPWAALADATERFAIPARLYGELLDGVGRDLGEARYEDWPATLAYCHGVAGVVGLISLPVFGGGGDDARQDAVELGHALQLTNILRDLREDARRGRWYLPLELTRRFEVDPGDVAGGHGGPGFEALVLAAAEVARLYYRAGPRLARRLPRSTRSCPAALAGVYRALLERIAADPSAVLRGRVGLGARAKVGAALGATLSALAR